MTAAANKLALRTRPSPIRRPLPRFISVERGADPRPVADAIAAPGGVGFPCVVKPLMLSGSRGVMRADDPATLAAALARLSRLLADPGGAQTRSGRRRSNLDRVVRPRTRVRRRRDPDARAPTGDGALRQARPAGRPDVRGDAVRHPVAPARRRPAAHHRARPPPVPGRWASRPDPCTPSCAGTTAHPVLIELAARSIGGLCARSLRFADGLSLEDVVVRHALGAPVPAREHRASGVMMIPVPARVPSALRAVDGVDDARAVAGIDDVVISTADRRDADPAARRLALHRLHLRLGRQRRRRRSGAANAPRNDSGSRSRRWSP